MLPALINSILAEWFQLKNPSRKRGFIVIQTIHKNKNLKLLAHEFSLQKIIY